MKSEEICSAAHVEEHVVEEVDEKDEGVSAGDHCEHEEQNEMSLISDADARVDPWTMVVHPHHTAAEQFCSNICGKTNHYSVILLYTQYKSVFCIIYYDNDEKINVEIGNIF